MRTRRWDFVSEHRVDYGVKRLCRVLGVSHSGFCRHLAEVQARAERTEAERTLVGRSRGIHAEHRGAYGAPRVHAGLRADGHRVNR